MMRAWQNLAGLLGRLVGLRTQESQVTVTVEGKWKGWFDPVRLGLAALVITLIVLMGFCAGCTSYFDDRGDLVTQGPYIIATPAGSQ